MFQATKSVKSTQLGPKNKYQDCLSFKKIFAIEFIVLKQTPNLVYLLISTVHQERETQETNRQHPLRSGPHRCPTQQPLQCVAFTLCLLENAQKQKLCTLNTEIQDFKSGKWVGECGSVVQCLPNRVEQLGIKSQHLLPSPAPSNKQQSKVFMQGSLTQLCYLLP